MPKMSATITPWLIRLFKLYRFGRMVRVPGRVTHVPPLHGFETHHGRMPMKCPNWCPMYFIWYDVVLKRLVIVLRVRIKIYYYWLYPVQYFCVYMSKHIRNNFGWKTKHVCGRSSVSLATILNINLLKEIELDFSKFLWATFVRTVTGNIQKSLKRVATVGIAFWYYPYHRVTYCWKLSSF